MWQTSTALIQPGVSKLSICRAEDSQPLSFQDFFDYCQTDESFARLVTNAVVATNYAGCFWELPALTTGRLSAPFECVVIDSPALPRLTADPKPFSNQFSNADPGATVIVFKNLSGDATLLSPIPYGTDHSIYAHLTTFLKNGPVEQVIDFWQTLADSALANISDTPTWISTAGLGVSWLHLRFDSRPKYYRYQPYKEMIS